LRDAAEGAAIGGAEVGGVNVVDDGVLPPRVRIHAGSGPARTSEGLCQCEGRKGAGEEEGEKSAGSFGHTVVLRCYPRILDGGIGEEFRETGPGVAFAEISFALVFGAVRLYVSKKRSFA
jgi:hypothetical protein